MYDIMEALSGKEKNIFWRFVYSWLNIVSLVSESENIEKTILENASPECVSDGFPTIKMQNGSDVKTNVSFQEFILALRDQWGRSTCIMYSLLFLEI